MTTEIRKKLTELQWKQIVETQTAVAQARAVFQKADTDAQRVVQLIFDAHSVPQEWLADLDQDTQELVCRPPDGLSE